MSLSTYGVASHLGHELVDERIQGLRQEAERHRLATRVANVDRARRQADRASDRLRKALFRI